MTMDRIRERSNSFINMKERKLNYQIVKTDQAPIGILLLNLYHWYDDSLYLCDANSLFKTITSMREPDGKIMYAAGADYNFVDAVGMYVPFLMEYFYTTQDSLAYKIADYNMRLYYDKGVNHESGIPFHGYNIKNGMHLGSANWGRCIG